MPQKKRIYFDHAATTPLLPAVISAMDRFQKECVGNPSSIHMEGQQARAAIDNARAEIARFFACSPQEIIFTSGATEANNLAIQGVISDFVFRMNSKPHVISTFLEHQSVFNTIKAAADRGVIEATFVEPDKNGVVAAEKIISEIKDNTILISTIFVANEIGTVQPIRETSRLISEHNAKSRQKIIFHSDAVQAVKFYNCNVHKLNVDLLTFSGHKINGPKGIGGLFIKAGTKISPLQFGGAQEYDKRAGTQNTTGIIGMAKAFSLLGSLEHRQAKGTKIRKLKNLLASNLGDAKLEIIGGLNEESTAPDIITVFLPNFDQDTVLARLDVAGFAISSGSACGSGSTTQSHVLKSLKKGKGAVIRISLAQSNSPKEINALADCLLTFFPSANRKKLLAKA